METLMNYLSITGIFINSNLEIILIILYLILFTLIMICDYKLLNKLLNQRNELSIKNFSMNIMNLSLFEILKIKNKEIKELKERVDQLKNQKKTQKYYLEKRFLAFEIATKFFLSKGAFKTIRNRYFIYNKKSLSQLQKINGEKDLKEQKK